MGAESTRYLTRDHRRMRPTGANPFAREVVARPGVRQPGEPKMKIPAAKVTVVGLPNITPPVAQPTVA